LGEYIPTFQSVAFISTIKQILKKTMLLETLDLQDEGTAIPWIPRELLGQRYSYIPENINFKGHSALIFQKSDSHLKIPGTRSVT
jgi:hypothetical protein